MHKLFLLGAKMKSKALKVSVICGRQVSALKGFKGDTASPVLLPPQTGCSLLSGQVGPSQTYVTR